ncbi:hypothetical protein ABZ890_21570 [Streptomyces sp. NPDC046984]|uniref:hypothetical protein n=1 Tax=Streptomyces sp. NPDC046984 TaxID=3155138 RepID=UPI00340E988B
MTTPNSPHLEGQPPPANHPHPAQPAALRPAVGEPKGAARKGVPSALRSNRFPTHGAGPTDDPPPDRPGIRIYAPPVYRDHYDGARWSKRTAATPTAAYACTCGHTETARGQEAVADLVADYDAHKHFCTGTPLPHAERRHAA